MLTYYGVSDPGIDDTDVCQYSDSFDGYSQDVNYDFNGLLTKDVKPPKTKYYGFNPKIVKSLIGKLGIYKDYNLKNKIRTYSVGTQFEAAGLSKTDRRTPVL